MSVAIDGVYPIISVFESIAVDEVYMTDSVDFYMSCRRYEVCTLKSVDFVRAARVSIDVMKSYTGCVWEKSCTVARMFLTL